MDVRVRHIDIDDRWQVTEVVREAFWNLYQPGCEEHLLTQLMWQHPDYLASLSFCIEVDGRIVGAILYSKSCIMHDYESTPTVTFGPVAILPRWHRQGLGRKLITHSINMAKAEGNMAKAEGYEAIITLGYRHHYEPYGFVGAKKYGISMPDGKYYKGLLALPLNENALAGKAGYVQLSSVFDNLRPEDVEEFDKNFPFKEKCIMPSQALFAQAVVAIDEAEYE